MADLSRLSHSNSQIPYGNYDYQFLSIEEAGAYVTGAKSYY